eukprot:1964801-Rhodomonas_salina.2
MGQLLMMMAVVNDDPLLSKMQQLNQGRTGTIGSGSVSEGVPRCVGEGGGDGDSEAVLSDERTCGGRERARKGRSEVKKARKAAEAPGLREGAEVGSRVERGRGGW